MENQLRLPTHYPVACHTDHVSDGGIFVAIKGMKEDGVRHISKALEQGARTIVVQHDALLSDTLRDVIASSQARLQVVPDARKALAQLSAQAFNFPANRLKIIGITGTKGKTTTTFLIEHVLKQAGYNTALLSTVKNSIGSHDFHTSLTTQHPDYLHNFFDQCLKWNVDFVVMEVAAQAFTLHRVEGIFFDAAVVTNFSQEHAEFYSSLDAYFAAKKNIVKHLKSDAPLFLNGDDPKVLELLQLKSDAKLFSMQTPADVTIRSISSTCAGLSLEIIDQQKKYYGKIQGLVGNFNSYNVAAAISCIKACGLGTEKIVELLTTFKGVPGRLNRYDLPNEAIAFIDYAHNPSSFEALLGTLRPLTDRLIVVTGAGGERDATKRPFMGAIAARHADILILTTDNPRSEDPTNIINDIRSGIVPQDKHKVAVELDRAEAIKLAYAASGKGSIIALLGKGPDEYQIVKGEKLYFSEAALLKALSSAP